jgi:RNA polymerase sigma factor (sigma-70 family)
MIDLTIFNKSTNFARFFNIFMEQQIQPISETQALRFERELLPHADSLFNFAMHLTGHKEEDSNDLVQDTYLKALRFMDKYATGTNPKAWLFTILKNGFINEHRKSKRLPKQVELEEFEQFHQEEDDTNYSSYTDLREDIFDNMMGDEVTIALNELDENYRNVLLLCDIEGFSYEEISEIIDVPIGTVRSRLHRARNLLKEKLKIYAESLGFKNKR